jgi:hypothetical protein
MMPQLRAYFFIALLLVCTIIVILHVTPRKLRFFDPDHRHCGNSRVAHQWAIHAVYGARSSERNYYNRLTVSTIEELPRNKFIVHKTLQTLAYIAQKTNRAIRINQSLLPGYNSENLQPYSLVNAPVLYDHGVDVVEMAYWNRASQVQNIRGSMVTKQVALCESPFSILSQFQNDDTVHEYLFSVKELIDLPQDRLLHLVGENLGYDFVKNSWKQSLSCGQGEMKENNPIPQINDPLTP